MSSEPIKVESREVWLKRRQDQLRDSIISRVTVGQLKDYDEVDELLSWLEDFIENEKSLRRMKGIEKKSKIPTMEVTLNSEVDFTLTGQSLLKLWYSLPGPTIPEDWWVDIPDRSYQMCKYTVTEGLYRLYCEDQGISRDASTSPHLPAVNVSFEDAQRFAAWLSKKDGRKVRLPTEDEWEYCCRAGSKGAYCFGDDVSLFGDYAWYVDNSNGHLHQPGLKKPNAWGLCDIHGNVWEWCDSWHDECKVNRVLRGGSFVSYADSARAAHRIIDQPDYRWCTYGFRLARDK